MKRIIKLIVLIGLLLTAIGCNPTQTSTGLNKEELINALKLDEEQYWSYQDDKVVFDDDYIDYNGQIEKINSFRYLENDQYELVCDTHTYTISYNKKNNTSIYIKIDSSIRQKYIVSQDKETEPTEDPTQDDPSQKEIGLSKDELFDLLYNNSETWSSEMSSTASCIRFIKNGYLFAYGSWPQGTINGDGKLTKMVCEKENEYQLDFHFDAIKDNKLLPDREAFDKHVVVTIYPEDSSKIKVLMDDKETMFYKDEESVLLMDEFAHSAKGSWYNKELDVTYNIDYIENALVFEEQIKTERPIKYMEWDFIQYGHYEYSFYGVLYDAMDAETAKQYLEVNFSYYPKENKLVVLKDGLSYIYTRINNE